jgi:hypothetical protein
VKKDHELHAAAVQYPIEPSTIVAAQLAELCFDLRAVREFQVRMSFIQGVDAVDLPVDRKLNRSFLS